MINLLYNKMYFVARKLLYGKWTVGSFLSFLISILEFSPEVESAFPQFGDSTETPEGLFGAGLGTLEKGQYDW